MVKAQDHESETSVSKSAQSLGQRVRSGSVLTIGGFGLGQILRLASNLILTRLLVPEAFGLMAIAVSINIWAVMLTDIGINVSVIRSRNSDKPDFLRTAWTTQILRNFLMWVLICIGAAVVYYSAGAGSVRPDSVFANSLLPLVMVALGTELLFTGFTSMNLALAQRRLSMGRVVALEIARQVLSIIVTVCLAFNGLGVFSLVIGSVAGAAFKMTLSHLVFDGPPMALRFVREHFDEIFHFGKWLIVASLFGFIVNRGDQLIFGWVMEADRFSFYAIAAIWISAATRAFQTLFRHIFVAAFSELARERPERLKPAYQKARLFADGVVLSFALGAFFLAEPVFDLIYPEKFQDVGYFVKLLSPMLLFLPYRLVGMAALAKGDSKRFTAITVVTGIAMMTVVPFVFSTFGEKAGIITFAYIAVCSLPVIWSLGYRLNIVALASEVRMVAVALLFLPMLFLSVD